jgi:hypothetical protein
MGQVEKWCVDAAVAVGALADDLVFQVGDHASVGGIKHAVGLQRVPDHQPGGELADVFLRAVRFLF